MRHVNWPRVLPLLALVAISGTSFVSPAAYGADRHFAILESIHVEPGGTLRQVTCIACTIRVEGVVEDSVFLVLGQLDNSGAINGDAIVIGGTGVSEGSIGGNAFVVAGTLRLLNNVVGNLIAVISTIELAEQDGRVGGDVWTVIGTHSGLSPDSVGGTIDHLGGNTVGRIILSGLVGGLLAIVLMIFAALLTLNAIGYALLGTDRLRIIADAFTGNAAMCFLLGVGTCFALAVIVLMMSMLLPVSLPVLVVFLVVSATGYCGLAFGIGRNLLPRLRPILATLAASVLMIGIQIIPLIGWFVLVMLWNIAVGAAILSGFGTSSDWLAKRATGRFTPPHPPA